MKRNQSGFTLIEIAIVLVIIGLLLGGVMKGQELINSAKVKNIASDFKNTSLYVYSYQDKYHSLPGDDALVAAHITSATPATTPVSIPSSFGDGKIDGAWDSTTQTDESYLFWQHVRMSGIAAGSTDTTTPLAYLPRNTSGGKIGVTNSSAIVITGTTGPLTGAFLICSDGLLGKFAKQLDVTMDDGNGATGSMMTIVGNVTANAVAAPLDNTLYTVCLGV